jgi:hypothetical protein
LPPITYFTTITVKPFSSDIVLQLGVLVLLFPPPQERKCILPVVDSHLEHIPNQALVAVLL